MILLQNILHFVNSILVFSPFFTLGLYLVCVICVACVFPSADWASRTYFSDNGSTAIEIALKMAFRKYSHDHGILLEPVKDNSAERCPELVVRLMNSSSPLI